jgi:acyl-CoA synthetase (NDP forming)
MLAADPDIAMRALSALYRGQRAHSLPSPAAPQPTLEQSAPRDWAETMTFCEECGITPAAWVVLRSNERAADACRRLTPPFVVKVLPSDVEHKTEGGFVKLRIASFEAVDAIAADFRQRLRKPHAGILVQEMVGDGVEVVLSCLRKTDFGPILSLGSGGVAIELYRDVAYLALPASAQDVRRALSRLKLWTLLNGFRGRPPADVEALVDGAVRLGNRFLATPTIDEIELNPVMVGAKDDGVRVVDALVTSDAADAAVDLARNGS